MSGARREGVDVVRLVRGRGNVGVVVVYLLYGWGGRMISGFKAVLVVGWGGC